LEIDMFIDARRKLERFRAKWVPVRVKKTRQIKKLERVCDSIRSERALLPQAALIVAAGLIFLINPVAAQQPTSAQRDAIRASCRSDYEAHCASIPPGGQASLSCLQKNMASLSQSCQQAVSAAVKPSSPANAPAAAAPTTAAPGTTDKSAATPAPATTNAPAAAAMPASKPSQAQVSAIRQACRSDYQAACAGVPTGGAAALNCLQKNVASLSQPCQQAVNAAGGASAPAGAAATTPPASEAAAPAAMPPMTPRQEIFLIRTSCDEDFRLRCGGVRLGGGRAVACLRANAASLSPSCQGALANLRH
jgi:hypothetical protein